MLNVLRCRADILGTNLHTNTAVVGLTSSTPNCFRRAEIPARRWGKRETNDIAVK